MSFYPTSIPRCQHIKINGTQCGSPALRRRRFCFFHQQWRQERISVGAKKARSARAFDLPVLEDANSIQITLMQIMRLILRGQIDPKSAGLLLYGLQTASLNLRHTQFEPRPTEITMDPREVADTPLGESQWDPDDFEEEEEDYAEDGDGEDEDEDEEDESDEDEEEDEEEDEDDDSGPPLQVKDKPPAKPNQSVPAATTASTPPSTPKPPQPARPASSGGWLTPDGKPVSAQQANQLRVLTAFVDYLAPLPPGEKD